MKIAIDARFYGPRQGGIGRYVEQLIKHLEQVDLENQYIIFLNKENWDLYNPSNPRFRKVLADIPWYSLKEQILMPRLIEKSKADLVHFPHFNVALFSSTPYVVTIHDLILLAYPDRRRGTTLFAPFYFLKYFIWRVMMDLVIKRAKKIIVPSKATKADVLKYFSVDPQKISVTYEGTGLLGCAAQKDAAQRLCSEPYLLYIGSAYPHKNLERLIEAFRILRDKEKMDLKLVLVGKEDFFYRRLQQQIATNKKQIATNHEFVICGHLSKICGYSFDTSTIIFAGRVSDQELALLYKNATLYVFPSLIEGFGLPALEAAAFNLPVIASSISAIKEVMAEAALYFDPQNIQDMVAKIKKGLEDENLRKELAKKGRERIKQFSWEKMARETMELYSQFQIYDL